MRSYEYSTILLTAFTSPSEKYASIVTTPPPPPPPTHAYLPLTLFCSIVC